MAERTSVLFVCNTLPPFDLSGAGEQVVQLARGIESSPLAARVHILGRGAGGVRGPKILFPICAVFAGLRWLLKNNCEVLQVHESDGGLLITLVRVLRRFGPSRWRRRMPKQLVVLQQVTYREEFLAVRALRDRDSQRVLARPVLSEWIFKWLRTPFHYLLGRLSVFAADQVLVPSRQTGAEVRRDYGAASTLVVPNTIAERHAADLHPDPALRDVLAQEGYFLYVGRLRIRKGVEVLLHALLEVQSARLVLVGDGERARSIEREVATLGLGERVTILGRRNAHEISRLLDGCRALVVPSTYEGMPLVILEAMDRGRAVIASSVSGIPEVVVQGETGWLVASESVGELAKALESAVGDATECQQRGAAGRRRIDQHYRPLHAVDSWLRSTALDRDPSSANTP